jgi:hypothetical protein
MTDISLFVDTGRVKLSLCIGASHAGCLTTTNENNRPPLDRGVFMPRSFFEDRDEDDDDSKSSPSFFDRDS